MTSETLADLLDEKPSRRAVKDIQFRSRTPTASTSGSPSSRDQNWKLHVPMFVRDTDDLYREVYPVLGHPEGTWQELREFYCPLSGRLLETEAVSPAYPVIHEYLAGHRGLL